MSARSPLQEPPEFTRDSPLLRSAYRFALSAHHGNARRGDTEIDHPVKVASLLHARGFEAPVVAAALLHDVVEDTAIDVDRVADTFGEEVASLVREMTEDEEIEPYEARKAEHRRRVARDRRVAAIYAADKVANARGISSADEAPPEKLRHYRQTLETLCAAHPDLPFLATLREELEELCA